MKIKVARVSAKQIIGQYGPTTKFNILNEYDNQWYSCFEKKGYTDRLGTGYEFEADVQTKVGNDGKTYNNIMWPKNPQGGGPAPVHQGQTLAQLTEILNRIAAIEKNQNVILSILESTLPEPGRPLPGKLEPGLPTEEDTGIPDEPEDDNLPF